MSEFQERLWSELMRDHASALACPGGVSEPWQPLPIVERSRSPRLSWPALGTRQLAGALAAIVALAIAVTVASVTNSPSSAAYAVTEHADGTVSVTVSELTGITGANAQLAKLGVPVRVVPVRAGCPLATTIVPVPPSLMGTVAHYEGQGILTRPDLVPAGETLVLAARQAGAEVLFTYSLYRGAPPTCVAPGDNHAG